jgi:hypothetical protein
MNLGGLQTRLCLRRMGNGKYNYMQAKDWKGMRWVVVYHGAFTLFSRDKKGLMCAMRFGCMFSVYSLVVLLASFGF